jgi:uncharacterized protein YbjT (DUF2867 family)
VFISAFGASLDPPRCRGVRGRGPRPRESENQTLVIGGPQPLSWRDIVATFAKELGRDVPVRTLPLGTPVPDMPAVVSELLTGAAPTPGQC